jgi:DNA polymerase-1
METIYIVDAVNFLFRSYYAIGPMTNDQGQSTGALFGFIRSFQKIIRDFSPTHAVCVFDGPENKRSRQAIYAEYKSHRQGAPEDLFYQFDWAYEYCAFAGIPTLCIDGVEADDAMAAVAVWAEAKGATVYLCSSDKDLMQLVNDHIFVVQAHKENLIIDAKKVEELFGVRPDQMRDLLAIMGDTSDNIPGLEGFGPKTAASLLQEFDTLDQILKYPEKVKGEKKQETLRTQKEIALLSRELATLDLSLDIPRQEEFYQIAPPNRAKLVEFFRSMKFNSLLRELESLEIQIIDNHNYSLINSEQDLKQLFSRLNAQKNICIHIVSAGSKDRPFLVKLLGIGFSYEPGEAWYVPYSQSMEDALRAFFKGTSSAFYGHNIKYDWHVLKNLGIDLKNICFDTLLGHYLLTLQTRRHNLEDLILEVFKKVNSPLLEKKQKTVEEMPIEKIKDVVCENADYTVRLKGALEKELREKKLEKILYDIELPLLSILAKMEHTGIYLDSKQMQEVSVHLNANLQQIKTIIFREVGEEFNLNSPKQLSEVLFEKLKIPTPKKKRTEFSTGADVLEELAPKFPLVQQILQFRVLEKLRSTYAESLPAMINPNTGRIHCTFNQAGTATGRLACQDPNLQNIPIRGPEGLAIRACFKPQKVGWNFLGADYSQIELRLLAHFSEDPKLLNAFQRGEDIHEFTASLIFSIPQKEVIPSMRNLAKTVNFGILYGQGAFGLARQLGISSSEAATFIKTYFERYPRVSEYLEHCKELARKTGVAKTLSGRQRPIPEIHSKNPSIRAAAERLAVNTPLQGTAADLIKMAMIAIDRSIDEQKLAGKMLLQIHDELIFEIPEMEVKVFERIVKEKMEHVLTLNVPIEVHLAVGKNWAEC